MVERPYSVICGFSASFVLGLGVAERHRQSIHSTSFVALSVSGLEYAMYGLCRYAFCGEWERFMCSMHRCAGGRAGRGGRRRVGRSWTRG